MLVKRKGMPTRRLTALPVIKLLTTLYQRNSCLACQPLVVPESGNEKVGQGDGGGDSLKTVLVQMGVKHCHVHLEGEVDTIEHALH